VRKGDTLSSIAKRYGTTVDALAHRNNIRNVNRIVVGQRICVPHGSPVYHPPKAPVCKAYYVVQYSDSLSKIAKYYGTTVQRLMQANNIRNPHDIYAGQRICIC
jgi:LysM repeat protein